MDKPLAGEALRRLQEHLRQKRLSEPLLSATAVCRRLFQEIEDARKDGFTYVCIADWLRPQGLDVSGNRLAKIIGQIRARKKQPLRVVERVAPRPVAASATQFRHSATGDGKDLI